MLGNQLDDALPTEGFDSPLTDEFARRGFGQWPWDESHGEAKFGWLNSLEPTPKCHVVSEVGPFF